MGVFYHEEPPHSNRCKCLVATLKEVFSHCQPFSPRLSTASLDEECPISDLEEEQEVVISTVRSRAMEKQKHKASVLRESFSWVYSPATRELYHVTGERITPQDEENGERGEEFLSVKSCFSCCSSSSAMMSSREAFYSVKTNLSLSSCSSMNIEFDLLSEYWKRSIIQEFCHCEGWPFGLCRKAVLLPPLPKSPSESWLSRKIRSSRET